MKAEPIAFEDIRAGDEVSVTFTLSTHTEIVRSRVEYTEIPHRLVYLEGYGSVYHPEGAKNVSWELIERPQEPLPTEPGSVIWIKTTDGVEGVYKLSDSQEWEEVQTYFTGEDQENIENIAKWAPLTKGEIHDRTN